MIDASLFEKKWKRLPFLTTYGYGWTFTLTPYEVGNNFETTGPYGEACEKAESFFGHPWNPIYLMP